MREIDGPPQAYFWHKAAVKYDTLTHCGVKEQGERVPCYFISAPLARDAYMAQLEQYKKAHLGNLLVWRARPEFTFEEVIDANKQPLVLFIVYSRLAIVEVSDAAEIRFDEEGNLLEHQDGDGCRKAAEAGSRDEQSRQGEETPEKLVGILPSRVMRFHGPR